MSEYEVLFLLSRQLSRLDLGQSNASCHPVTKISFEASISALTKSETLFALDAGSSSHLRLDRSARLSLSGIRRTPGLSSGGFA